MLIEMEVDRTKWMGQLKRTWLNGVKEDLKRFGLSCQDAQVRKMEKDNEGAPDDCLTLVYLEITTSSASLGLPGKRCVCVCVCMPAVLPASENCIDRLLCFCCATVGFRLVGTKQSSLFCHL